MNSKIDCVCQTVTASAQDHEALATEFYAIRDECPVLKLLIPDVLLDAHKQELHSTADEAHHRSIPFLAFKRHVLPQLTAPIHRHLLSNGAMIIKNYRQDLRETWLKKNDVRERYDNYRSYFGRIMELVFVGWLEENGWTITHLEALGGTFDIESLDPDGIKAVFEVKSFSQHEDLFALSLERAQTSPVTSSCLYSAINYLAFRLSEAAGQLVSEAATKQLANNQTRRIVVAILDDYDMFELQLNEKWIDWTNPTFNDNDPDFRRFLDRKGKSRAEIEAALSNLRTIDALWFFSRENFLDLKRKKTVSPNQSHEND